VKPTDMDLDELIIYLGAVAASDNPIDGREKDLLRHLLRDFGANQDQAEHLVAALPVPFQAQVTLNSLNSRDKALKLLRAMLVISYCDGSFDPEEVPFLTPVVDRFSITPPELSRLKQHAMYFLRLAPPSITVPPETVQSENWPEVQRIAQEQFNLYRKTFYDRFRAELQGADAETCYLAMAVGAPTFDTKHVRDRFLESHPDFFMMEDEASLKFLRDETEKKMRSQWDAAYSSRCNSCYLEAPGKRRDSCPRCSAEYGEPPRR
jgi:uncharacterized tellurite resistance protein B-like protein